MEGLDPRTLCAANPLEPVAAGDPAYALPMRMWRDKGSLLLEAWLARPGRRPAVHLYNLDPRRRGGRGIKLAPVAQVAPRVAAASPVHPAEDCRRAYDASVSFPGGGDCY